MGRCQPHGVHPSIRENYDIGLTGLALLAFLGAGYTPRSKDTFDGITFGQVVENGLAYLVKHQEEDGCIGPRRGRAYLINHIVATQAICEAYGSTGEEAYKDPAQSAVDFLSASRNDTKGWGSTFQSDRNDTLATGLAVMALKSADLSGINFDRGDAYDTARNWLDEMTYDSTSGKVRRWKTGYRTAEDETLSLPEINEKFDPHQSMTSIGIWCRIIMDKKRSDNLIQDGVAVILQDPPNWKPKSVDYAYWHIGSNALFQYSADPASDRKWKSWNRALVPTLVPHQDVDDHKDTRGSWEPVGRWCGVGGRVYATALNALTLEVYYRYAPVFGSR